MDSAAMTIQEAVAGIAALCGPGEAAVTFVSAGEGLSWCVAAERTAHDAARNSADADDPDLLLVAVVAADRTLTGYKPSQEA